MDMNPRLERRSRRWKYFGLTAVAVGMVAIALWYLATLDATSPNTVAASLGDVTGAHGFVVITDRAEHERLREAASAVGGFGTSFPSSSMGYISAYFATEEDGAAFCMDVVGWEPVAWSDAIGELDLKPGRQCIYDGVDYLVTVNNFSETEQRVDAYCRKRGEDGLIEAERLRIPKLLPNTKTRPNYKTFEQQAASRVRSGHRETLGFVGNCPDGHNIEFELVPIPVREPPESVRDNTS